LLEELVTLYNLICTIRAKPILVAITKCDWKGQFGIAQPVHFCQAMVRENAELESSCQGSLSATSSQFKHTDSVSSDNFPMPRRVTIHVIFNCMADDLALKAVGERADDVKRRALLLPLAFPEAREELRWWSLVKRAQPDSQWVVLRRFRL